MEILLALYFIPMAVCFLLMFCSIIALVLKPSIIESIIQDNLIKKNPSVTMFQAKALVFFIMFVSAVIPILNIWYCVEVFKAMLED